MVMEVYDINMAGISVFLLLVNASQNGLTLFLFRGFKRNIHILHIKYMNYCMVFGNTTFKEYARVLKVAHNKSKVYATLKIAHTK